MIAALLLLLAVASDGPAAAQTGPVSPDPLLQEYSEIQADRMWGAHLYCSPPGHQWLLRAADARIRRIRASLITRFGRSAVAQAEARRQALFDEQFGGIGAGIACRHNDRAMNREYNESLRLHYDELLRPIEKALRLRAD